MASEQPGRNCPLHYRYRPESLAEMPATAAKTLYVIGGLYGNHPALRAALALAERELLPPVLCFNGDFNWFNVDDHGFEAVNSLVLQHAALRGNVETEISQTDAPADCGCGYPDWVDQATVDYSNRIIRQLAEVGQRYPALTGKLRDLPMYRVFSVGEHRIGVVHGDAESLAGWGFAQENLTAKVDERPLLDWFDRARVDVFASSHTCLPVLREFSGRKLLINNGAAGLPNFSDTSYGMISRISTTPPPCRSIYGIYRDGLFIDALPLYYDTAQWRRAFMANWPPGSPGYESYFDRILAGPDYSRDQALRVTHALRSTTGLTPI